MRKNLFLLMAMVLFTVSVFAQTTGSISGTVTDSNGAVIPNANVEIKGEGGQKFTANTTESGTYKIPAVGNGFYTVTITAKGFKKVVTSNVKVDVGVPTTVNSTLEVGGVDQVVEVTTGADVLQTQTPSVGTTVSGRQITETPIPSRDALDLVAQMPGTSSVGRPRASSINGLPKGSLSISIDGVDVQDNLLRSSDGFFTYVRPRVDAIEEVTVSTSNPGAEASGDGAVSIKFVTKRGTNDYKGGVFWQHRNDLFNSAYWYNNQLKSVNPTSERQKNKIKLNQYGGRLGGRLPFPHFGEGGPFWHSGKDRAFFFVNYEQFRLPESQSRGRTVLTPDAQAGNFSYIVGGVTQTRNIFTIAGANAQLATADPVVASLLAKIRTGIATTGVLTPITNDPNRLAYTFTPQGYQFRKFLALRLDFNLTKNHSLEFITNRQQFVPSKDFLNAQEERFPGFPAYAQGSFRNSYSTALRSTLSSYLVNEARVAISTGKSEFSPGISAADFAFQGGYALGIDAAGITTATSRNSYSNRNTPTYDYTDNMTWIHGNHSINFGGQYKLIKPESTAFGRIVPTVSFGLDATDSAFNIFSGGATGTLPNASAAQLTEARNLYATLIGRVTGYTATAYLGSDGKYSLNGQQTQTSKQRTYGLYVQDSWRINPSLSINYGIRWQPQGAYTVTSGNYARLNNYAEIYGVSGLGNIFKPGTLTGIAPTVVGMKIGEEAYKEDKKNFAPSVGVVWSPNFGESGVLSKMFGTSGKSVFRGGYAKSFVREGTALIGSILGANPGGNLAASRSVSIGNLTVGTNLRDAGNPNLTAPSFLAAPAYPLTLGVANSANAFDPNLKTGSVDSFSFGYQREIDKNTVVEFRYVGNRGHDLFRQHNINELNTVENGFASEFAIAQSNLYANLAFNGLASFAYTAAPGTAPLPKILAYFNTAATYLPNAITSYTSTLFVNTTLLAQLSRNSPAVIGFASNVENSAARRTNALANGLPSNFFYVNPATAVTGAFVLDNSARSWYDSGVVEVRRRLSQGLRVNASFVWSKAQSNSFQSNSDNFANFSHRENGLTLAKNIAVFDVSRSFKLDATYDLPFGKGRAFFGGANGFANGVLGGWTILPTVRWQSGSPFSFGNVQLVGLTKKDLQKLIKIRKNPTTVTFLPDDIILNTQKAFDISVTNTTTNGGYGTTFGAGGPTGKFIAPAGYGNCQSSSAGKCGFNNLILYGPGYFKFDVSVAKKIKLSERINIEFKATALDALNHPNFRIGGWAADVVTVGLGGPTFGQLLTGSAYQDLSTTNDPGGRLIDFSFRLNF